MMKLCLIILFFVGCVPVSFTNQPTLNEITAGHYPENKPKQPTEQDASCEKNQ